MKSINISKDIVSLSDFKNHASSMLKTIREENRALVITQNGKAAAVLVSPSDYDFLTERIRFVDAVQRGLEDVREGRIIADEELEQKRRH